MLSFMQRCSRDQPIATTILTQLTQSGLILLKVPTAGRRHVVCGVFLGGIHFLDERPVSVHGRNRGGTKNTLLRSITDNL